jgi:hypothetical protein
LRTGAPWRDLGLPRKAGHLSFFQNLILLGFIFDLFEREDGWGVWNTWLT